ncbi:hypothetical protein FCM35_KLT21512 [Carex littledalei]|uniref:Uncharacterized protein n=1 Tax=Carex littledalei TaxID=544730 RepID=A0A833R8A2_9POAL|nr:hypothetical protein FCM35_KLT21512 [Carex littledalei]
MRREGRQHGMVVHREIYSGFNKPKRLLNELKSVPTTKFMTRVSSKPTNHSRYTGRWSYGCLCPRCGDRNATLPINKSRGKAKGTHKLRHYNDVAVNHLLVSQRLIGSANLAHWVRFNHGSANWLLSQLTDHDYGDVDIDCHDEFDEDYDVYLDDHEVENGLIGDQKQEEEVDLGFYLVEFVRESDGEGDWCFIGDF